MGGFVRLYLLILDLRLLELGNECIDGVEFYNYPTRVQGFMVQSVGPVRFLKH